MNLRTLKLLLNLHQENRNLFLAPPKTPRPQRETKRLNPFQHRRQLEQPHLLELLVRGPWADGHLELPDLNILKAGGFHLFFELGAGDA